MDTLQGNEGLCRVTHFVAFQWECGNTIAHCREPTIDCSLRHQHGKLHVASPTTPYIDNMQKHNTRHTASRTCLFPECPRTPIPAAFITEACGGHVRASCARSSNERPSELSAPPSPTPVPQLRKMRTLHSTSCRYRPWIRPRLAATLPTTEIKCVLSSTHVGIRRIVVAATIVARFGRLSPHDFTQIASEASMSRKDLHKSEGERSVLSTHYCWTGRIASSVLCPALDTAIRSSHWRMKESRATSRDHFQFSAFLRRWSLT